MKCTDMHYLLLSLTPIELNFSSQDRKHMKAFEKLFSRPENNNVSLDNSVSAAAFSSAGESRDIPHKSTDEGVSLS